jgi:hypothetical protein
MPDYPAGFFILPDIQHAGLSGRRLPDIQHPAVAGYPASGIFFEKHPASGKKNRSGPILIGLGRISGNAGLSGRIFRFPAKNSAIRHPAVAGYTAIRQLPDVRHPAFSLKNIRHPAKKKDPAQPYLLYIFI